MPCRDPEILLRKKNAARRLYSFRHLCTPPTPALYLQHKYQNHLITDVPPVLHGLLVGSGGGLGALVDGCEEEASEEGENKARVARLRAFLSVPLCTLEL